MEYWSTLAAQMVEDQIEWRGVTDNAVLNAMRSVPRHIFVPPHNTNDAYIDRPLPLGECQTISQPYMVARMTELLELEKGMKVLEIGSGSGYQAAVLAQLGCKVWSVERVKRLAEQANKNLAKAGLSANIILGDGVDGFADAAPYNRVIVTAAIDRISESWEAQLYYGGIFVAPVNVETGGQRLLQRRKTSNDEYEHTHNDTWHDYCRFVPLLRGIENNSTLWKIND